MNLTLQSLQSESKHWRNRKDEKERSKHKRKTKKTLKKLGSMQQQQLKHKTMIKLLNRLCSLQKNRRKLLTTGTSLQQLT